jgi:hypothetical protein
VGCACRRRGPSPGARSTCRPGQYASLTGKARASASSLCQPLAPQRSSAGSGTTRPGGRCCPVRTAVGRTWSARCAIGCWPSPWRRQAARPMLRPTACGRRWRRPASTRGAPAQFCKSSWASMPGTRPGALPSATLPPHGSKRPRRWPRSRPALGGHSAMAVDTTHIPHPSDGDSRFFPGAFFPRTAHPNSGMLSSHARRDTKRLCLRSVVWGSFYRPSKCTRSNICPL